MHVPKMGPGRDVQTQGALALLMCGECSTDVPDELVI